MTLDSSALVAVLFAEFEHLELIDAMIAADTLRVGAPTLVETTMVASARRGKPATSAVDGLVRELAITIAPFGDTEWRLAIDAFHRYGRGRHKAALNFGDCLAYASARAANDPLLFVGADFAHTDIVPALPAR